GGFGVRLVFALLQFELIEPRLEHRPGDGAVLDLRALLLARHRDARRDVGDAHGRVGRVDVLAAGPRRAIRVDAALALVDLDVDVVVDHRVDPHGREARV